MSEKLYISKILLPQPACEPEPEPEPEPIENK